MKNSNTMAVATPPVATPPVATPPANPGHDVGEQSEARMIGYVRVSTREQNEDRQVIAMREFGVPEDCILVEKQSGKDFNRPIYLSLVASLRPGEISLPKWIQAHKSESTHKPLEIKVTEKVSSEKGLAFSNTKKYNRGKEGRWENAERVWTDSNGVIPLSESL